MVRYRTRREKVRVDAGEGLGFPYASKKPGSPIGLSLNGAILDKLPEINGMSIRGKRGRNINATNEARRRFAEKSGMCPILKVDGKVLFRTITPRNGGVLEFDYTADLPPTSIFTPLYSDEMIRLRLAVDHFGLTTAEVKTVLHISPSGYRLVKLTDVNQLRAVHNPAV